MLVAKRLAKKLSPAEKTEVAEWWRGLAPADRLALRRGGRRPPTRVVARFLEPDEAAPACDDFYEYLVNHEIYIDDGPKFHICSAHPDARAAVARGRIPAAFRCPRGEERCPMRVLLDLRPGCNVHLSLVREEEEER